MNPPEGMRRGYRPVPESPMRTKASPTDAQAHGSGAYDAVVPLSRPLSIAMVSMHTSPLESPGSGDAGGMNVVERHTAEALGELGHRVELITRRSDGQPDLVDLGGSVTVRHIDAGPRPICRSRRSTYTDEFRESWPPSGRDIVHSHHWMSGMARSAGARLGCPACTKPLRRGPRRLPQRGRAAGVVGAWR